MATETTPVMLTRKLGEGSCGSVFCGSLTASGKRVAVKVVRKGTSAKAALNLHRVRTEANVMARLDHRNVARCLGTWETSEHFYLFLKFARGGDLCDRLLHGGPMTERSARRRFGQLLAAVAHLHAKGLAHRDIKPENILLDELGHFMLADFGLAVTHSPQKKVSGRAGTVGYAAPEVWVDRPYDAAAADVFSCGSVLMAMVTARSPFQGATDQETLAKSLRGELDLPTGLSLEAVLLIKSMVAPDPAKRITLADALDHPWFTGEHPDSVSRYRPWAPLEEDDSDFDSDEDDDDQDEGDDEVDRNDDGVDDDSVDDALYELVRTKPAKCA